MIEQLIFDFCDRIYHREIEEIYGDLEKDTIYFLGGKEKFVILLTTKKLYQGLIFENKTRSQILLYLSSFKEELVDVVKNSEKFSSIFPEDKVEEVAEVDEEDEFDPYEDDWRYDDEFWDNYYSR